MKIHLFDLDLEVGIRAYSYMDLKNPINAIIF